jgi:type II secretory pathway component GspD/PulD (secretin)
MVTHSRIGWFYCLIILWIFLALVTPTRLFGAAENKQSQEETKTKTDFVLTIKDNLISLNAKNASLKEIVEEIGRRMKINVVANIPEEKKVTTKFDKISLEGAIKKLREYADIIYLKGSGKDQKKITKIMVFPKREGTAPSKPAKEEGSAKPESKKGEETVKGSPQPEPFKFEFDPSKFEEKK